MKLPPRMSAADALTWTILLGMLGSCLILGSEMGFGIEPWRAVLPLAGLTLLLAGVVMGRRSGRERVVASATALLQMTLFTILGVTLAYLLAARAGPLWDGKLVAADARLGLAWPSLLDMADRLPAPTLWLGGLAYHSLSLQMVACIFALVAAGQLERLRLMVAAASLAGVVTILVSGLMPAFGNLFDPGAYRQLWPSIAWLERDLIAGLRNGNVRLLDLSQLMGIVSFPSYHATLPVILTWALRPVRGVVWPAAAWAGLTVVATPVFGGHYGVDVLAGLLLAMIAIATVRVLAEPEHDATGAMASTLLGASLSTKAGATMVSGVKGAHGLV